jgi:hypothetical protein
VAKFKPGNIAQICSKIATCDVVHPPDFHIHEYGHEFRVFKQYEIVLVLQDISLPNTENVWYRILYGDRYYAVHNSHLEPVTNLE